MENNIYYNYVYLDPRKPGDYVYGEYHFDYEPFYIGKGSNGRYKSKHKEYCEKIRKDILLEGLETIYHFLYEKSFEDYAYDMEKVLIKAIGRKDLGLGPLLNKSDGGKETCNVIYTDEIRRKISEARKGKHHSDATRRKIGEARKGEKNPNYGKAMTEEHKRKMSEEKKGEKNPMYGKNHSEETRKKMSISHKRRITL
jgi:hypothetical protein